MPPFKIIPLCYRQAEGALMYYLGKSVRVARSLLNDLRAGERESIDLGCGAFLTGNSISYCVHKYEVAG